MAKKNFSPKKTFTKKIIALLIGALLFSFQVTLSFAEESTSFYDVSTTHPHFKAIETLKRTKILDGYPDGSFQPDKIVNRAEALKIILSAKKISLLTSLNKTSFTDIATTDWFASYVETAKKLNIISGNPDGSFAPSKAINKGEFLKMLLLAFEVKFINYQPPVKPLYPDIPDNKQWYIPYIDFAKSINLILPNSSGNIEPAKSLTRGEIAEITYRLLTVIEGGPTKLLLSRAQANLVEAYFDLQSKNLTNAGLNIQNAQTLVFRASEKDAENETVKANLKLLDAFEKLIQAYQKATKNPEEAIKIAGTAYNVAEEAKNLDSSLENLASLVKTQAKTLADTLRKEKTK